MLNYPYKTFSGSHQNWGLIPGKGWDFFSSPLYSDWFWGLFLQE